ncbi:MAG TPA: methyltransferase domain-containing protein, partial [Candidatus Angelobacter sp.]|nr:methyltransferase domain-containing protein [Candidatus Angelobacter sp.]
PFASAPAIRNEDALNMIVQAANAAAEDTSLDVACGPGLLACAFARVVRHASGIDMTPAMLEQAKRVQQEQGLNNLSWRQGDVTSLPYPDADFSIVSSRFVLHHLEEPLTVLREMVRVCQPGGRVVIADMAPVPEKADALNAAERLRDPSHVRAMPPEELIGLFSKAGLGKPQVTSYRMEGELEDLLSRSFPNEGNADRLRQIFADSIAGNSLDLNTRREKGKIYYSFPVVILVAKKGS